MILKYAILSISMAVLPCAGMPQENMPQEKTSRQIDSSTVLVMKELPSSAYKAILKIGLDNKVPVGIVVGPNKSICNASLVHLGTAEKLSVASLIDVFNRDVEGYTMRVRDGVINVDPVMSSQHAAPLLEVRIPKFKTRPDSMAGMSVSLWFALQAVIAPEKGSAFAGGMSRTAEAIPAIEVNGQGLQSILNTIVSEGHGGVWVIRDVSLDADAGMPFEVRSYIGEDELIRRLSLC